MKISIEFYKFKVPLIWNFYDLARQITKEYYQETYLSNKTYCQRHKVLISAKKTMICCLITVACF